MDNAPSISSSSSVSSGSSSSTPSPPTSPLRSSPPPPSSFRPTKTSAKTRRSRKRISEVCDSCKKKKRRVSSLSFPFLQFSNSKLILDVSEQCNLKEPCGSCESISLLSSFSSMLSAVHFAGQSTGISCTYKRYSLNVKFPQLSSNDLNTVSSVSANCSPSPKLTSPFDRSQLLVQLDESKNSQTTTSLRTTLVNISKRLGLSLDELVHVDSDHGDSEQEDDGREEEDESESEPMELSDQVESHEESESNPADSTFSYNGPASNNDDNSSQSLPYTRRQTRSSIKLAPLSVPASPSTRTGAYPAPLPSSTTRIMSPMRYHFPGLFLAK